MNNFFHQSFGYNYRPKPQNFLPVNYTNNQKTFPNNSNNFHEHNEIKKPHKHIVSEDKPIFEFNGIKLYTDDLLILLLIYFLYKENVKDSLLYIALLALLIF